MKIMRLFLMHPDRPFDNRDIGDKSRVPSATVKKEISLLRKVGFVKKRSFFKEHELKNGTVKKKRVSGWILDGSFPLLTPVNHLLVGTKVLNTEDIVKRFKNSGKVKLIVVSGVFIDDKDSRLDMLIVVDEVKKGVLENALRTIESEIGRELEYALMDSKEFLYRLGMYDKFVRDVFDFPHKKLLDKIGL